MVKLFGKWEILRLDSVMSMVKCLYKNNLIFTSLSKQNDLSSNDKYKNKKT